MQEKTISIIGLGKLGAPMAAAYADKGYKVIGVDTNPDFVRLVNEGKPPVQETDLADYLLKNRENISATQDFREAVLNSEITFIIVPTPSLETGDFSTKYAISAAQEIGKAIKEKNDFHLVVLTSTVTPQSTQRDLLPVLEEYSGKKCGQDFGLCYNPEFIALGSVIHNLLNPDFILVGESDKKSGEILENFYQNICPSKPIKRMNIVNAEITKIALNTYVTTKISYANMLSELCEKIPGGNVDAVTDALGCDERIGKKYLKGALGYGGPCFCRDNRAIIYVGKKFGLELPIPEATDKINQKQAPRVAEMVLSKLSENKKVAVLGLSYKPHTNVIEESQGMEIVKNLIAKGIQVSVFDPAAIEGAKKIFGEKVVFANSVKECLDFANVAVFSMDWPEFKNIDPSHLEGKTIIDCWKIFDKNNLKQNSKHIPIGRNYY